MLSVKNSAFDIGNYYIRNAFINFLLISRRLFSVNNPISHSRQNHFPHQCSASQGLRCTLVDHASMTERVLSSPWGRRRHRDLLISQVIGSDHCLWEKGYGKLYPPLSFSPLLSRTALRSVVAIRHKCLLKFKLIKQN